MKAKASPAAQAAMVIGTFLHSKATILDIIEAVPEGYQRLLDALGCPTNDAIVAMEEALQNAIPEDQRRLVAEYSDLRCEDATTRLEAGFMLGVAFARGSKP